MIKKGLFLELDECNTASPGNQLTMSRFFFLSMCLGIASSALGQQPASKATLKDAEFVIEKELKHQLPEASRLFESAPIAPHMPDPLKPLPATLSIIWPAFDTLPRKTKILRAKQDMVAKLHDNYLQGGHGNFYTPYLAGFFTNKPHPRYTYGLHFKHLSAGQARYGEESHNLVQLHGQLFTKPLWLAGEMGYNRDSYPLYNAGDGTPATLQQQSLHQFAVRKRLANYIQGPFNYQLDGSLHYLADAYQARETQWVLQGSGDYALNDIWTLKAITDLHFTKHSDSTAVHRNLCRCKPMLSFVAHSFDVQGGVNVVYQNDASDVVSALNVYPVGEVKYALCKWLRPYVGVRGDIQRNSLQRLLQENPRLAANLALRNTNQRWLFYGGARGDVVEQISFHAGLAVGSYQNLHCLVNSAQDPRYFDVHYDLAATLFNTFGELTYTNRPETLTTRLRGDYFYYGLKELPKPWHRPRYQLDLLSTYRLYDKIVFKGSMYWVGGLEALDVAAGVPVALADVLDLGLGIDYLWSQRFSIFLNFQNLLAKPNERYLHYPARGLHCLAGLTYAW